MELNPELLRKTASAIRELNSENDELKAENAELKKQAEATSLAVSMLKDGELDPEDFETKVAEFLGGDLEVIKTAMAMNTKEASDFGVIHNEESVDDVEALDPLTSFLLSTA